MHLVIYHVVHLAEHLAVHPALHLANYLAVHLAAHVLCTLPCTSPCTWRYNVDKPCNENTELSPELELLPQPGWILVKPRIGQPQRSPLVQIIIQNSTCNHTNHQNWTQRERSTTVRLFENINEQFCKSSSNEDDQKDENAFFNLIQSIRACVIVENQPAFLAYLNKNGSWERHRNYQISKIIKYQISNERTLIKYSLHFGFIQLSLTKP